MSSTNAAGTMSGSGVNPDPNMVAEQRLIDATRSMIDTALDDVNDRPGEQNCGKKRQLEP